MAGDSHWKGDIRSGLVGLVLAGMSALIALTAHADAFLTAVIAIVVGLIGLALTELHERHMWPFRRVRAQVVPAPATPGAPLPQHVIDSVIKAEEYAPVVHDHQFTRCEIRGTIHLPGSYITNSKWVLGGFQVVSDVRSLPVGTLSFIDCHFDHCTFTDCTGVGTTEQVASLRAALGITGDRW